MGGSSIRPARARNAVVGLQMAGSALLLAVAALFLRAALRATRIDPGYATQDIVAFSLNTETLGYDTARAAALYRQITDRLVHTPGVEKVALARALPLLATTTTIVRTEQEPDNGPPRHSVEVATVSGSYFETLGIPLLRGVALDTGAAADGSRQAVISRSTAAALWPGTNPLGQRLYLWRGGESYRVVGIAADASLASLAERDQPTVYFATPSPLDMEIIIRTRGASNRLVADVPSWVRELDPQIVVQSERFEDRVAMVLMPARIVSAVTGALGVLSFLVAAIGVASVVSVGLRERQREIAVRLAVGASGGEVVRLMMRQGTPPILIGASAGLFLAVAVAELLRGVLFGLDPLDPAAYGLVVGVLVTCGAAATYLPSRAAARIGPATVLRDDG